jgi:cell division transport system ATP-binding protein
MTLSSPQAVIAFDRVRKSYGGRRTALDSISFEVVAGEMVFLTGHSGAGKSTLLRLIALLERPTSGQVHVEGHALNRLSAQQAPLLRRRIGLIFQDHRLLNDRSVYDNVAMPLAVAGIPKRERGRRVRAALDQVGLLERERARPIALSGGEQQRVGIARAIVTSPPVLLADEPTGNLDPGLSEDIFKLFARLNQQGTAVLIASHDLELVRRMGCRVLVLRQGQLIDDIEPEALRGQ